MSKTNKTTKSAKTTVKFDTALTTSVQSRILWLLGKKEGSWRGTMTQLNTTITAGLRKAEAAIWPGSPSALRRVVNAVVPALRRAGVSVKFGRTTDHMRTRFVNFVQK